MTGLHQGRKKSPLGGDFHPPKCKNCEIILPGWAALVPTRDTPSSQNRTSPRKGGYAYDGVRQFHETQSAGREGGAPRQRGGIAGQGRAAGQGRRGAQERRRSSRRAPFQDAAGLRPGGKSV